MRVVQVANFYGPRSGGLRTAVDRLGAEYYAEGLSISGSAGPILNGATFPQASFAAPARLILFTGGYRCASGPVTSLLGRLSPALEVSDS